MRPDRSKATPRPFITSVDLGQQHSQLLEELTLRWRNGRLAGQRAEPKATKSDTIRLALDLLARSLV